MDMTNDLRVKVKKDYYKVVTVAKFLADKGGIKPQALQYAISKDLVDYVQLGHRGRAIVLTEKSLAYSPNKSPHR